MSIGNKVIVIRSLFISTYQSRCLSIAVEWITPSATLIDVHYEKMRDCIVIIMERPYCMVGSTLKTKKQLPDVDIWIDTILCFACNGEIITVWAYLCLSLSKCVCFLVCVCVYVCCWQEGPYFGVLVADSVLLGCRGKWWGNIKPEEKKMPLLTSCSPPPSSFWRKTKPLKKAF